MSSLVFSENNKHSLSERDMTHQRVIRGYSIVRGESRHHFHNHHHYHWGIGTKNVIEGIDFSFLLQLIKL